MSADLTDVLQRVPLEMLQNELLRRRSANNLPSRVARAVAVVFGLQVEELTTKGRSSRVLKARQMAMATCRQEGMTLSEVARFFGCSCHSSVIHAVRRHWHDLGGADYWERRQQVVDMLANCE
jgi:chromosomal replication initiation ATPase DnaA